MKCIFIVVLLVTLFVAPSYGQLSLRGELPRKNLILSGGWAVLDRPKEISENWKTLYNFGLGFEIPETKNIRLLITADYTRCEINAKAFAWPNISYNRESGGDLRIISLGLSIKILPATEPKGIGFYLLGGGGFYFHSISDRFFIRNQNSDRIRFDKKVGFSVHGGLGLDLPLKEDTYTLFIQARYIYAFTRNDRASYIPITAGVKVGL